MVEGAAAGTAVGLTAASTDINGGAITYSLTAYSSGGGFQVNASTGVVTVFDGSKISFAGSGAGHAYDLTVSASDGAARPSASPSIPTRRR